MVKREIRILLNSFRQTTLSVLAKNYTGISTLRAEIPV